MEHLDTCSALRTAAGAAGAACACACGSAEQGESAGDSVLYVQCVEHSAWAAATRQEVMRACAPLLPRSAACRAGLLSEQGAQLSVEWLVSDGGRAGCKSTGGAFALGRADAAAAAASDDIVAQLWVDRCCLEI
jgi:hypothetical protein